MTEDRQENKWAVWLAVAALVVIAGGLRGWKLDGECYYSDECASVQHLSAGSLSEFLSRVRTSDPPMTPAFFVLEYGWSRMVGQGAARLRLLPLFLGLLAIPLLYLLGALVYGRRGGLAAAMFFTFSLTQIYYSQEMRPYALVLVLALLSLIALWHGLRKEQARRWWALHWLCNILLPWCHLFTVFFVLSQGCYLLAWSAQRRRWTVPFWWGLSQVPNAVLLFLWVHSINYAELSTAASWRLEIVHSYLQPLSDFLEFAGAGVPLFRDMPLAGGRNMAAIMWRFFGLLVLLYLVLNAWRGARRLRRGADPEAGRVWESFLFVVTLLAVPSVTLFLVSALVYSCHSSRYVLYGSIPFALLLGGCVALLPGKWARGLVVASILAVQCINLAVHPKPWRPDTVAAAGYLETRTGKDAHLTVHHASDIPSLLLASPKGFPARVIDGVVHLDEIVPAFQESARQAEKDNWLLVSTHQLALEKLAAVEDGLRAGGWTLERAQFGEVNPIYVYRVYRP